MCCPIFLFGKSITGGPPLVQSPLVRIFKVISKIRTSGISRIGYEVKFLLVEIGYVVPTSTNFTSGNHTSGDCTSGGPPILTTLWY